MARGADQRDEHIMVFLHINMLVDWILRFEGVEVDVWEILSRQFRCCQTGDRVELTWSCPRRNQAAMILSAIS